MRLAFAPNRLLQRGPIRQRRCPGAARRPTRSARAAASGCAPRVDLRQRVGGHEQVQSRHRRRRVRRSSTTLSIVYDGPGRSISMRVSSNGVVAGDREARHQRADRPRSSPAPAPLCGGCAAGMNSTRSRPMASAASVASQRCPTCGGSNVPPRIPMRRGSSPVDSARAARVAARRSARSSLVLAPLELGATDVDGGPRAGAASPQLGVDPEPLEEAPEPIAGLVVLEVGARRGGLDAPPLDAEVRHPRPPPASPRPSGSKRWTTRLLVGRPAGSRSVGLVERGRRARARSSSRPVPSWALTADRVGQGAAQLRPALAHLGKVELRDDERHRSLDAAPGRAVAAPRRPPPTPPPARRAAPSTTPTRTRVRSTWRRNWWPRPLPLVGALDEPGHVGDDRESALRRHRARSRRGSG